MIEKMLVVAGGIVVVCFVTVAVCLAVAIVVRTFQVLVWGP